MGCIALVRQGACARLGTLNMVMSLRLARCLSVMDYVRVCWADRFTNEIQSLHLIHGGQQVAVTRLAQRQRVRQVVDVFARACKVRELQHLPATPTENLPTSAVSQPPVSLTHRRLTYLAECKQAIGQALPTAD